MESSYLTVNKVVIKGIEQIYQCKFEQGLNIMGIRNFWLIKCQRCKEENLSQRII